ncbi:uncharacterized protein ARMOST_14169 [Armillaria ostoyae]|uniref:ATP-dependent DNA helicase n=1 Tax=Armillaria ostoyae TaxID=47428 RepID=A0A284RQ10_ARMOS|nr:uncharacterized protein ARMOST_14169 [Armillaria ostoyae]
MDDARTVGCFGSIGADAKFQPPSRIAHREEMMQFDNWHQQLTDLATLEPSNSNVPPLNLGNYNAGPHGQGHSNSPTDGRPLRSVLNTNQRMVHNMIENHLLAQIQNRRPEQLLMLVLGAGGTGKMVLINAISETYTYHAEKLNLGLTASSGVASTLFRGSTTHSWAGILTNSSSDKLLRAVAAKRQAHIANN